MVAQTHTNEIAALIEQVKAEDARYTHESRSAQREPIMIPVVLTSENGDVVHGFSRNMSADGICLVTTQPTVEGASSNLLLSRSDGQISEVTATCKWSQAFGSAHCISGWHFQSVVRNSW